MAIYGYCLLFAIHSSYLFLPIFAVLNLIR